LYLSINVTTVSSCIRLFSEQRHLLFTTHIARTKGKKGKKEKTGIDNRKERKRQQKLCVLLEKIEKSGYQMLYHTLWITSTNVIKRADLMYERQS
jgi:hypothetical protein